MDSLVAFSEVSQHRRKSRANMGRKRQKIFITITSAIILTLTVYFFCQSVFFEKIFSTFAILSVNHSSSAPRDSIRLRIGKTAIRQKPNTNEITIDRDLFDYLTYHLRETPYAGVGNYSRFMMARLGLKELTDVEPLAAGMGPVVNDVTSFQYPLTIAPCRQKVANLRGLFIAVISAPNNFEKRAAIRQTWHFHLKNQSNVKKPLDVVGFGFVTGLTRNNTVGQKLIDESLRYNDILQVDVEDKYRNLSVKVAGLFNWINFRCSSVDFVLKVDDDVYVNVHNLATVLHSLSPSIPSVYGHKTGGDHPSRTEGKWPSSFENWPWFRTPNYLQGTGIVISGSAVRPLLAAMQTTPYYIWDDIYLIGLCAVKAQIKVLTSKRIFLDQPGTHADACFVRNTVMWTASSEDDMRSSHVVSHNLYRNVNKGYCLLNTYALGPNETLGALVDSKIIKPANASEFIFKSIH